MTVRELSGRGAATILAALLALTALTTAVAYADLGRFAAAVAIAIATAKALLVAFYFMELRASSRVVRVYAAAGILFLALLLLGTLDDSVRRLPASDETPAGASR